MREKNIPPLPVPEGTRAELGRNAWRRTGRLLRARAITLLQRRSRINRIPVLLAIVIAPSGYSVSANEPYIGNELIERIGDPQQRIHNIQVQINKKRFMDTNTFSRDRRSAESQSRRRSAVEGDRGRRYSGR
jgi:hypothetical protein